MVWVMVMVNLNDLKGPIRTMGTRLDPAALMAVDLERSGPLRVVFGVFVSFVA